MKGTENHDQVTHALRGVLYAAFAMLSLLLVSGASAAPSGSLPSAVRQQPQLTLPPCTPTEPYTVTQTTGAIVPGVADVGNHCEDCVTTITLPFTYALYGTSFTRAALSSNGNIQFVGSDSTPDSVCLPATGFESTIFAHWDDLRTDLTGDGIFTSVSGTAPNRIFNIEWRASLFIEELPVNLEVRLYEGQNTFDVVYGIVSGKGMGATIGVQLDEMNSTEFSCDTILVEPGMKLVFAQPPCPDTPTPTITPGGPTFTPTSTSTITPTPTQTNTPGPTFTPTATPCSTYTTDITGSINTSDPTQLGEL
ncbi:MAG: hypothetical protein ACJ78Q_04635, partial [Chloroflexia bacterium]